MTSFNPYRILGLRKSATPDEIEKAFRRLAWKWHPDRNPGNEAAAEKFKSINEAHAILMDERRRRDYDATGRVGPVVDELEQEAWNALGDVFEQVLDQAGEAGIDISHGWDVLNAIKTGLANALMDIEAKLLKRHRRLIGLKGCLGRFVRTQEGENEFENLIRHEIAGAERFIEEHEKAQKACKRAQKILKQYADGRGRRVLRDTGRLLHSISAGTFGGIR